MTITSFKVLADKTALELILTDASTATTLSLWTNKTYKTVGLETDLSDKLNGAASQTITITLADLDLSSFDGVYFIDVVSPTETICGIAAETTRYKECILNKRLEYVGEDNCLEYNYPSILNAQSLLLTLDLALEMKLPQEILTIVYALDKFCTEDCKGCGEYKNI
jgi:hypothetical protein